MTEKFHFTDHGNKKQLSLTIPDNIEDFFTGKADIFLATTYSNKNLTEADFQGADVYKNYKNICNNCFEKKPMSSTNKYLTVFLVEPRIYFKNAEGKYIDNIALMLEKISCKIFVNDGVEYKEKGNNYFFNPQTKEFKTNISFLHLLYDTPATNKMLEFSYKITYCLDLVYTLYYAKIHQDCICYLAGVTKESDQKAAYDKLKGDTVLDKLLYILKIEIDDVWDGETDLEDPKIYPWSIPMIAKYHNLLYHDICESVDNKLNRKSIMLKRILESYKTDKSTKDYRNTSFAVDESIHHKIITSQQKAFASLNNQESRHSMKLNYVSEKDASFLKTHIIKIEKNKRINMPITDFKSFILTYGSQAKENKIVTASFIIKPEIRHKKILGLCMTLTVLLFNHISISSGIRDEDLGGYADCFYEVEDYESSIIIGNPVEEKIGNMDEFLNLDEEM